MNKKCFIGAVINKFPFFQSSSTLDYYQSDCQQKKTDKVVNNGKCEDIISDGVNHDVFSNNENQINMFDGCKVNILCQV
jgi:hypothetical protein